MFKKCVQNCLMAIIVSLFFISCENPLNDIDKPQTPSIELKPEISLFVIDELPSGTGTYDFGTVLLNTGSTSPDSKKVTFTIQNSGKGDLNIQSIELLDSDLKVSDSFSLISVIQPIIHTQKKAEFTIEFKTSREGLNSGQLKITNNDSDENPYTIHLTGLAVAEPKPLMSVSLGSSINSGDTHPMGSFALGTYSDELIFTIENKGNAKLELTSNPIVKLSGVNTDNFILTNTVDSTLEPLGKTEFKIQFKPLSIGEKKAQIAIANNDSEYILFLKGTGTKVVPPASPSNLTGQVSIPSKISLSWIDNSINEEGFNIERKLSANGSYSLIKTLGPDLISYDDDTVLEGTAYFYRINSFNSEGNSSYSNETEAISLLSEPLNLTSSAVSSSHVELKWDYNKLGALAFVIESRLIGGTFVELDRLSKDLRQYEVTGLAEGSIREFRIKATSDYRDSNYSNISRGQSYLLKPASFNALSTKMDEISLSWLDQSNLESSYEIVRTKQSDSLETVVTLGANMSSYTDLNLVQGELYSYKIRARGPDSSESLYEIIDFLPTKTNTPKSFTAISASSDQIRLTWNHSGLNSGFIIELKNQITSNFELLTQVNKDVFTYTDINKQEGSFHQYRIKAINPSYSESTQYDSSYSAIVSYSTELNKPGSFAANRVNSREVNLSWIDLSSNENGYIIERKGEAESLFTELARTGANSTSLLDNSQQLNTTYTYRIRAFNTHCQSELQEIIVGSSFINENIDAQGVVNNQEFGKSIASSSDGNTIVVGNGNAVKAINVFKYNGSIWNETKITPIGHSSHNGFADKIDMSSDGNKIIVSSASDAAFLYTFNGSNWTEEVFESGINGKTDQYGLNVSISGDGNSFAVSAHGDDEKGKDTGAIYLYTHNGITWDRTKLFATDDRQINDLFGYSLSLNRDGSKIVVGAREVDQAATDAGAVYLLEKNGLLWDKTRFLPSGTFGASAFYGQVVDISQNGDTFIVSAVNQAGTGNTGAVYIYKYGRNQWHGSLVVPSEMSSYTDFGHQISLSDDGTSFMALSYSDQGSTFRGASFVYELDEQSGSWKHFLLLDSESTSVSVSGDGRRFFVGTKKFSNKKGRVQVFK